MDKSMLRIHGPLRASSEGSVQQVLARGWGWGGGTKRAGESASVRTEAWMARRREGAARWRPTEADSGSRPVADARADQNADAAPSSGWRGRHSSMLLRT